MNNIEYIKDNDLLMAIIIPSDSESDGINFVTPDEYPLQLGILNFAYQHKIQPHIHSTRKASEQIAQEVLFVKKGKLKINFYNNQKQYLFSRFISKGDFILLASGGHGFEMLEDCQLIEVKQGPFIKDDKIRFDPEDSV